MRGALLGQAAALVLHLRGELPGAADHFVDAPHALAVGAEHRDRAEVVQHVLGGDGLRADARLREGHVLRHRRIQVVADHDHVEVLVEGVDRVGVGRIGRRGQAVHLPGHRDDVGRVAAAGALGVVHVDGAAVDRRQRVLQEARLVERVGVQLHLEVHLVGHRQAGVDHRRHGAPVLVDLHPEAAAAQLVVDASAACWCCRGRGSRSSSATAPRPAASCRRSTRRRSRCRR